MTTIKGEFLDVFLAWWILYDALKSSADNKRWIKKRILYLRHAQMTPNVVNCQCVYVHTGTWVLASCHVSVFCIKLRLKSKVWKAARHVHFMLSDSICVQCCRSLAKKTLEDAFNRSFSYILNQAKFRLLANWNIQMKSCLKYVPPLRHLPHMHGGTKYSCILWKEKCKINTSIIYTLIRCSILTPRMRKLVHQ